MIESVLNGLVLALDTDGAMTLQSKNNTNMSNTTWKHRNTRALDSNTEMEQSNWKNKWTVSFITSGYKETSLANYTAHQTDALLPICYKSSPAFSASFEEFAKGLEIRDPRDEDECREMREALGFDKDCES
jgi:transposase